MFDNKVQLMHLNTISSIRGPITRVLIKFQKVVDLATVGSLKLLYQRPPMISSTIGPRKMVAVIKMGHTNSLNLSLRSLNDKRSCAHDLFEWYLLYRYAMMILMIVEIVMLIMRLSMVAG